MGEVGVRKGEGSHLLFSTPTLCHHIVPHRVYTEARTCTATTNYPGGKAERRLWAKQCYHNWLGKGQRSLPRQFTSFFLPGKAALPQWRDRPRQKAQGNSRDEGILQIYQGRWIWALSLLLVHQEHLDKKVHPLGEVSHPYSEEYILGAHNFKNILCIFATMGMWSVRVSFHVASLFSCSAKPPFLINTLLKKKKRIPFCEYFLNSGG